MAFIDENGNWLSGGPKPYSHAPGAPVSATPTPGTPLPGGGGGGGGAAGSIQVGGYTPDYKALLKTDPGYAAWLGARPGREGNLATNRAEAIRQAILQFGALPPGFSDKYGDVRPEDISAATGNTNSVEAQIARAYQQGITGMRNALGGRGMLDSGELGYGQQQADIARGQQEYDAGQQFLAAINQAIHGYTGGMTDIAGEEPGQIGDAQGRVEQQYQPTDSHAATLVPGSQSQYGFPVYQDPDGNMWRTDASGNPVQFTPPAAPPAPAAPGPINSYLPPGAATWAVSPGTFSGIAQKPPLAVHGGFSD